jgi:hypothetical protein
MRWEVELYFEDRDGNRRSCYTHVEGLATVADLVTFANAFGDRAQALSSSYLVRGRISAKVQLTVSTVAHPDSNVQRKLLILSRGNGSFGSLEIPSPAMLNYESNGDYAGFRLRKQDVPSDSAIAHGISALSVTVRPDGLPFPTDDWVLALMSD